MRTNIDVIVDMQYGSTGKGLFAGYLAANYCHDTLVTAWGPNAGHTFIDDKLKKYVNIALPNGIVSPGLKRILLGPGSVIDVDRLRFELNEYKSLIADRGVGVFVHENAAVRLDRHIEIEKAYAFKIGSTMKGVGAAVVDKIRRDPSFPVTAGDTGALDSPDFRKLGLVTVGTEQYVKEMHKSRSILVEGAQGYSLSINHGFYPFTTSRDCTVQQLMADCAVPWNIARLAEVHGVMRTFPIRVANRFDANGVLIGTSGPCYPDQREINWSDIGVEPELTTVTKLQRRVFSLSYDQIRDAIVMNGVKYVFINFANYTTQEHMSEIINTVQSMGAHVYWTGHGPTVGDVRQVVVPVVTK